MAPKTLFEDRQIAARFYADRGAKRFFVFGLYDRDLREWQVREDHEWLGIDGGSGLIASYAESDRQLADAEAARLNALDAETVRLFMRDLSIQLVNGKCPAEKFRQQ